MKRTAVIIGILVVMGALIYSLIPNQQQEQEVMDISTEEFKQKVEQEPGVVIDVRTLEEYEEGHLAQTDHHYDLLNGDFEAQLESLDKDQTYYLYCRTGNRSGKAAEMMVENGFKNVYNIGGFEDLVQGGLEAE